MLCTHMRVTPEMLSCMHSLVTPPSLVFGHCELGVPWPTVQTQDLMKPPSGSTVVKNGSFAQCPASVPTLQSTSVLQYCVGSLFGVIRGLTYSGGYFAGQPRFTRRTFWESTLLSL